MKRITTLLSITAIVVLIAASCQKVSDKSGAELIIKASTAALKSVASGTSAESKSASGSISAIVLDTFLINIEDIKFEFDESYTGIAGADSCSDDCNNVSDDCNDISDDCDDKSGASNNKSDDCNDVSDDCTYKDIRAEGPYLINVLSPEVSNGMIIDNFAIPNAIYDEIEFNLASYQLSDNEKMLGRSVFLAGTINGVRFELWTNKVKEIEIEFHDQSAVNLTGENIKLYIDISLEKIKTNLEAMNLDTAVDGNNNGCIEIGYNDTDGNQALAGSILNAITGCFDLDDEDCED
jgi:hypothetical protein